jgi:hypothetical protein
MQRSHSSGKSFWYLSFNALTQFFEDVAVFASVPCSCCFFVGEIHTERGLHNPRTQSIFSFADDSIFNLCVEGERACFQVMEFYSDSELTSYTHVSFPVMKLSAHKTFKKSSNSFLCSLASIFGTQQADTLQKFKSQMIS